jgi:hypothetical protein
METSLITSRKNVLFCQVKLYKGIKNAQASKITVLALFRRATAKTKNDNFRDWQESDDTLGQ